VSGAKVMVSIRLKVPPAAAFELFTSRIDAWWQRGPKYRMASGGRLQFEPGEGGRLIQILDEATGERFLIGRILVWQPGERLTFEWRLPNFTADQVTEVDIAFVPVAEGTKVTLEHRGWDTLPPGHPARHGIPDGRFMMFRARWWDVLLESLRDMADE
jgi:Activator of Hsp90 ATPase homolog 1-like protein